MNQFAAAIAAAAQASPSVPNAVLVAGRKLNVDGDYCAYSCAGSDECPPAVARKTFIDRFEHARFNSRASEATIHLSARDTDKGKRGLIATVKGYQDTRQGKSRPRNWLFLREYLESLPGILMSSHREADDSMAAAAYADPHNTVTHSRDKDMRQFPGWHLTWVDHHMIWVEPGTYELVGPDDLIYGHKWLWLQLLQGDTADNIPGLPQWLQPNGKTSTRGCGDGSALKILAGTTCNQEAEQIVLAQYINYYGEKEYLDRFVEQMGLLWLRSREDAPVADFYVSPHSILTKSDAMYDATLRLHQRVKEAHAQIKIITDSCDPLELPVGAEW